jgi:hypothetical protein
MKPVARVKVWPDVYLTPCMYCLLFLNLASSTIRRIVLVFLLEEASKLSHSMFKHYHKTVNIETHISQHPSQLPTHFTYQNVCFSFSEIILST